MLLMATGRHAIWPRRATSNVIELTELLTRSLCGRKTAASATRPVAK
jgi:hypothetical protein